MFEIITRSTPFSGISPVNLAQLVAAGQRPMLPTQIGESVSPLIIILSVRYPLEGEYLQIMKNCWAQDPEQRPDFKQIIIALHKLGPDEI